ncbi:AAA family ATPase [Paenibacillus sp. J5C_2022]|uniref:DnaB-like helicase C-terminal domain-containing protein n=1 Tax=Paenibacillus sp. J5C2022 TaxID=2977129 RepID=UPI0021D3C72C|nr:DnaB-like helicase C-terminal domain-containing protein [Paenibacillus sp. J5C2022]MCU6709301.1 AAA family ATPase [Paenibacillus sp. J5C2022]
MSAEESLLSKVVDNNDVLALDRFGIRAEHFESTVGKAAESFIRRYAAENKGQAPSYATLVANVPDFTYIPAVTDSYEYLTRKLKETWGKREIAQFFGSGEINAMFGEIGKTSDIEGFFGELTKKLAEITVKSGIRKSVGIDLSAAAERFMTEYRARKDGRSFKIWPSKFPGVNAAAGGGYYSGNMYTWFARSGRGKSVITLEEAIEAAIHGATVLIWTMEMILYQVMARAYTSISGRQGIFNANIDGIDYDAGFDNRAMLSGKLTEETEAQLETFVNSVNSAIEGRIIVRAVDDPDFRDRSLRQLEADIREVGADVVVIDPIYYMDYEANTSKTAGGDVAATSKGLRRLAGATNTVIHIITQADEDTSEKDGDERELKPPVRAEVKKTKAVLEDASLLFAFDSLAHEGRGMIALRKGRDGGEDTRIEIVYLPNFGIVREPVAEDMAAKFVGNF